MSGRELPIEILNERRRLAVRLRLSGMTLEEVAAHAELSIPTVIAAHRAYREGGWDGVAVRPRGRKAGAGRALPGETEASILDLVSGSSPEKFGLSGKLWSEAALIQLIRDRADIDVATRTVRRYLERWGLRQADPGQELRAVGDRTVGGQLDAILAEYESLPARHRGRVVWLRTHVIAFSPGGEENERQRTFLVGQFARGQCYWVGLDRTPDLKGVTRFVENLAGAENCERLWVFVSGIHLGSRDIAGLESASGVKARCLKAAGTKTRLGMKQAAGAHKAPPAVPKERSATRPARSRPPAAQIPVSPMNNNTPKEMVPVLNNRDYLTHLQRLEAESIHIMREVVAETENPVMLYSIGKDSAVMLHLAMKAFYPSKPPFPLLHVDTRWKFREMYTFRDRMAEELGMDLLVHINPEGEAKDINPFTHGSAIHTDIMKTEGLKQALDKYGFDAAFGGARRDEEKSRAKERVFSFRTAQHRWDPKNQRPELWKLYNARKHKGESIRVFPLSNWTELDIWQYIYLQNIPIVPLYFAAERPVVERNGTLVMVDDDRMPLNEGEVPMIKKVRFRTLGCYPLTGAIESEAQTLTEIIQEMLLTRSSERQGRVIDRDAAASMELKKQEGYF